MFGPSSSDIKGFITVLLIVGAAIGIGSWLLFRWLLEHVSVVWVP